MTNITQNKMIAWLEGQKINADQEGKAVIEELLRTVRNPFSFPRPEKIELWNSFVGEYVKFYEREVGIKPAVSNTGGKKLKEMIYIMLRQDRIEGEADALEAMKAIWNNWHNLSPFLQNQVDLTQQHKYFGEIIKQIRSGHHKSKQQASETGKQQLKQELKKRKAGDAD